MLVTTMLDSAHQEHFHHRNKLYWTALTYTIGHHVFILQRGFGRAHAMKQAWA